MAWRILGISLNYRSLSGGEGMTIFLGDFGSESSIVGSGDGLDVKSGCGRFSIKVLMWL